MVRFYAHALIIVENVEFSCAHLAALECACVWVLVKEVFLKLIQIFFKQKLFVFYLVVNNSDKTYFFFSLRKSGLFLRAPVSRYFLERYFSAKTKIKDKSTFTA
jgi:hypothetical protein